MRTTKAVQVGGMLWALLILTIVVEVPVALAWDSPYDPLALTISDLGATTCTGVDYPSGLVSVCSPLHGLMNAFTAGGGILVGVGALLLRRSLGGGAGVVFAVLLVVSAFSWVAGAVVAVDEDLTLHALLAFPAFLAQNVALLFVSRTGGGPCLRWRRAAAWVGTLGLVATIITVLAQGWGLPLGFIERIALYPSILWLSGVGISLVLGAVRATNR